MPKFVIHGLSHDPERRAVVTVALFDDVDRVFPDIAKKEMVVQAANDTVHDWDGEDLHEAPYIEICSTTSPDIPTLDELAAAIKPFCDAEGLDIETLQLTNFYPKNMPLPESR